MTLWAVHPHPKNDEVLSSWIARVSYANNLRIPVFCEFALKADIKHLLAIDYSEADGIIQTLVECTGVNQERIREASLLTERRYVFHNVNSLPISWVVPTKYKKKSLSPGLNYCPLCLDEDPYFRKSWRFSFNPVCLSHKTLLRQLCPHCQKPYHYIGSSNLINGTSSITICKHCRFDLRRSPRESELELTNEITASFQKTLEEGIALDCFIHGNERVRAIKYLGELRQAMSYSTNATYVKWLVQRFRSEIPSEIDPHLKSMTSRRVDLDHRSPLELSFIMILASVLLKDWSARLSELMNNFHPELNSGDEYSVEFSSEEILNARKLFLRKIGRYPSAKELELLMSEGIVRTIPRGTRSAVNYILTSPDNFTLVAVELNARKK